MVKFEVTTVREPRAAELLISKRINCRRLPGDREPRRGCAGSCFTIRRQTMPYDIMTALSVLVAAACVLRTVRA